MTFRIRSSSAAQPVVRGKAEGATPSGSANLQRSPVPGNDVSVPTEPSPRRPPKSAGATSAWCSSNMLGLGPSDRRCKSCRADHFSELQAVYEIFVAREFNRRGLGTEMLLVLVHSGSRGLGENYPARQRGRASGGCRGDPFVRRGRFPSSLLSNRSSFTRVAPFGADSKRRRWPRCSGDPSFRP